MAMACFGLVTFLPLPLLSLPCFMAFISRSTLLPAALPYFGLAVRFFAAVFLVAAFLVEDFFVVDFLVADFFVDFFADFFVDDFFAAFFVAIRFSLEFRSLVLRGSVARVREISDGPGLQSSSSVLTRFHGASAHAGMERAVGASNDFILTCSIPLGKV